MKPRHLNYLLGAFLVCALSVGAQPVITVQPTNQVVLKFSKPVFNVAVSGIGPFTYQWQFNGTNLPVAIITVAGGIGASGSDGGVASSARLYSPQGVSFDANGNLYIAEHITNTRIRKVDTNGIISTVAGNSTNVSSGDGGWATNASLNSPSGTTFDVAGNLYIAEEFGNRIRRIDTNGIITTVAGNGTTNRSSGDGIMATNSGFAGCYGVVVDKLGNLIISDEGGRIRRVGTNGIITTMAGGGTNSLGDGGAATNAKLTSPYGVALDAAGNLFFAEGGSSRVRKVDTNGIITTVVGKASSAGNSGDGGAATNAKINLPFGVAVDPVGNLFVADWTSRNVRKVDTNGIITTVTTFLNGPHGVACDAVGNLFIGERDSDRVLGVYYAGMPTLTINGAATNNSGNYSVIITDSTGSVTSSVVTLTVNVPPAITKQPTNQIVFLSSNALFSVTASGDVPLAYQWRYNSVALSDGGNVTGSWTNVLSLSAATTNNAGNYSVIVSSPYGSVTSAVVSLTVAVPPTLQILSQTNGQFSFVWNASSNQLYQLQSTTNLVAPVWQDVGAPITATNNQITTTNAADATGQQFYRVRLLP